MGTTDEARFSGIARLYGREGLQRLQAARVTVVGVGGVGTWVAEALARTAVGRVDLVDLDDVCVSNTNRQLVALQSTVGRPKAEAMADRLRDVHPGIDARADVRFFTEKTAADIVQQGVSVVVDAIDGVDHKCLLVARCRELGVPLVVSGGAGGRRDPSRVGWSDLADTEGDRLLSAVRKRLRQRFGFPRKGPFGVDAVFSREPQVFPTNDGGVCERRDTDRRDTDRREPHRGETATDNLRLDCASGYGTAAMVTGAFGLLAAHLAVRRIVG